MVLGGHLDAHLQVLPDVCLQHRLEALQAVLHREGAKEVDKPVSVEEVGVNHCSLDVVQVGVVFKRSLEQACFLTQGGNVSPVIVGEHLVAHDRVGNLGRCHQVHLKQPRLQRTLGRTVVLECVEEEGSALLHHVLLHEHIDDLGDVCQGLIVSHKHTGKLGS